MPQLALQCAVTLWAVTIGVWDRIERRIPNWLVFPVMLGALAWRVYEAIAMGSVRPMFAVLIAWIALFLIWQAHFYGGGDAKFLMGLLSLFPTLQFLLLLCLVVVVTRTPVIVYRYVKRRRNVQPPPSGEATGRWLPTEEDLRKRGLPNSWTFALAGVIYVWCAW